MADTLFCPKMCDKCGFLRGAATKLHAWVERSPHVKVVKGSRGYRRTIRNKVSKTARQESYSIGGYRY